MHTDKARVSVPAPGPLLKKVCRHFSHKVTVTFDESSGEVLFPFGRARMNADPDKGILDILVEAETPEQLEQTRAVTAGHVERMSTRHPVTVVWETPSR